MNSEKKHVSFTSAKPEVHELHVWKFAYHQARLGSWKASLCDRMRFAQRIRQCEFLLKPILLTKIAQQINMQTEHIENSGGGGGGGGNVGSGRNTFEPEVCN